MSGFAIGFSDHKRHTGNAEELAHLETFLSEASDRCGLDHRAGFASVREIGFASGYYFAQATKIYLDTNGDMSNPRLAHAMRMNEFVGLLAETYQIDQYSALFREASDDGKRFVTSPGSFVPPQPQAVAAAQEAPATKATVPRFR